MISYLHLRTLAEVIRCGSFAEAGRTLGRCTSSISQQMSALERELGGVQLFVRAAKSVRPTAAGWRVARVSRVALPVLDSIDRDVRAAAKD